MAIGTISTLSKPSNTCIFHGFASVAPTRTSLASGSRFRFRRVQHGFPYNLHSIRPHQREHMTVSSSLQPLPPPTPPPSNPFAHFSGKGWIAGLIISLLLPFLRNKWGPLLLLKKEVDKDIQTVEDVVEVFEKVADGVDKIAEDVAEDLPQGQLKMVATKIEHVAEKVATTAHLADEAIDKVQELEERMGSFLESNEALKEVK